MFVVGGILLIVFPVYEWRFAKYPVMPRRLLNRNFVLSLAVLAGEYGMWEGRAEDKSTT